MNEARRNTPSHAASGGLLRILLVSFLAAVFILLGVFSLPSVPRKPAVSVMEEAKAEKAVSHTEKTPVKALPQTPILHFIPVALKSEQQPNEVQPSTRIHAVVEGDTLTHIAVRCGTRVEDLLQANPFIKNADLIYVGQRIRLPQGTVTSPESAEQKVRPEKAALSRASRKEPFVVPSLERHRVSPLSEKHSEAHLLSCETILLGSRKSFVALLEGKRRPPSKGEIFACIEREYGAILRDASRTYGIPKNLLAAILYVESRGYPRAVSPTGCLGLMQLLRPTAADYGADLARIYDPRENIRVGTRVFADYLRRYSRGDLDRALASYNLGPGAVEKKMRDRAFDPARFAYVRNVREAMSFLE